MIWLIDEAAPVSKKFWVTVSEFNAVGFAFYQTLGFRDTGRLANLVKEGESEILLRRSCEATHRVVLFLVLSLFASRAGAGFLPRR